MPSPPHATTVNPTQVTWESDSRRPRKLKQRTSDCQIRQPRGDNIEISKWSSSGSLCALLLQTHKTETPGEQDENRPQDTRSSSRRKPSTKHQELTRNMYPLLNQALRHEEYTQTANRNCQVRGARKRSVKFRSVTSSGEQLKHHLCAEATSGSE